MTDCLRPPVLGNERVLIVGAGSLGTVYGGFLARAGFRVEMLAREAHARAIQDASGVWIESEQTRWLAPVLADWRPSRLQPAEVLILCSKVPDSLEALAGLGHVRSSLRLAVSFQSGIEKDQLLADWCGQKTVVGGASQLGAVLAGPGLARQTTSGPTFLGELDGSMSPRIERFAGVLQSAGLEVIVTDQVLSVEWSKLALSVAGVTTQALTSRNNQEVLLTPELAGVYIQLIRETAAVAAAAGVAVEDWRGLLPVKTIVSTDHQAAVELLGSIGRDMVTRGIIARRIPVLEMGRRMEADATLGFVVHEARRLGVPVPAVEFGYRLLTGINRHLR